MKSILISQPQPKEKSPYLDFVKKYNLNVDFIPFIEVVGVSSQEFRQTNIQLSDYESIIFNSRFAIDHYFRLCEEMRHSIHEQTKFFCPSEGIALYIQKYTAYRKRRVFFGNQGFSDLADTFKKYKDKKFLIPCAEIVPEDVVRLLKQQGCQYSNATLYKMQPQTMSFDPHKYDIITFFSSTNVQAFLTKYRDFDPSKTKIACFGETTRQEWEKNGIAVDIYAPTKENPSMVMAIENFLKLQKTDESSL